LVELEYCVIDGLQTGSKIDDWTQVDMPFKAFADPVTTTIAYLSLPQYGPTSDPVSLSSLN
jgi:hypothetical protein